MRKSSLVPGLLVFLGLMLASFQVLAYPPATGIEKPVKGKEYLLTKERGPWMIMVATFHATGGDTEEFEGKSPDQAADELIFELRELGFPAYKFVHDPGNETITTQDSQGREDRRKNLRRIRSVCVIGGNYRSIDDPVAQSSLAWIKKLNPKCLSEGVVFVKSKARPTPLAGAFLTLNPMQSTSDMQHVVTDTLLLKLNSGENYSLLENRGEYTLMVARFYGKSQTVDHQQEGKAVQSFVEKLAKDTDLDNAALSARELTAVLRGKHDPTNTFNNVDAYIWHDRYESFVTVGSFNSLDDPRIKQYMAKFGPQTVDMGGGAKSVQPGHFGASGFGKKGDETRLWLFEAEPAIIRVPKTR